MGERGAGKVDRALGGQLKRHKGSQSDSPRVTVFWVEDLGEGQISW